MKLYLHHPEMTERQKKYIPEESVIEFNNVKPEIWSLIVQTRDINLFLEGEIKRNVNERNTKLEEQIKKIIRCEL